MEVGDDKSPIVYLSGPVTGNEANYKEDFAFFATVFKELGMQVLNPVDICGDETDYETCMDLCLDAIATHNPDALYMLPGWVSSKGCVRELNFATLFEIPCFEDIKKLIKEILV